MSREHDREDTRGDEETGADDVFETIRRSCRAVVQRARRVRIEDAGLEAFAARLVDLPWPEEDLDPAHHFQGSESETLAFVIALDAINFGSGWFPALRKRQGLSGYRTIATACKERFEREGAWSGETLRATTVESMAGMLDQDIDDPEVAELMALYAKAWRDLGSWLRHRHADRFEAVVESAAGSAARLVRSLAEMTLYRDVARYEELEVPFYKRAQITAADLARAFGPGSGYRFEDLDSLTLFADNLVPHALRCEGVLVYDAKLADRIDGEKLIDFGSPEEVEIRASAVEAVERLTTALADRGRPTTAHALDGLLWNAGQAPAIKARPRHRTRCPYY